ncbi:hypothetical protein [Haladaptatus sp. CMSO5]|uniref:hypothetical protein n=1 Tax=Haladaptatus sp. CMSO5 TaxID=3120514 RepID=UPI002FCE004E
MGFATSGATAVIFIGLLVAVGTLYPAMEHADERVFDARDAHDDRALDQRNTAITVTQTTYNATLNELTVTVENTGSTTLSVTQTDLLVDGAYQASRTTSVGGDANRTVWVSGETLTITVTGVVPQPSRVKVVTEYGVAAVEEV